MPFSSARLTLTLFALALLGGCGDDRRDNTAAPTDPAIAEALADEIMVDPDLSRQNPAGAVLAGGGPAAAPMPPEDRDAERIAAARAEALALVGGKLLHAPQATPGGPSPAGETAALTARAALAEWGSPAACAAGLQPTFVWAARLPAALPVYPRGHVQEAAGTDAAGCHLRSVNYRTPVPAADVIDFYWTRARRAGFAVQHGLRGADHAVSGSQAPVRFAVYARTRDGLTEVDLVTTGE